MVATPASTCTTEPVSPSYLPVTTLMWSPTVKYFLISLVDKLMGAYCYYLIKVAIYIQIRKNKNRIIDKLHTVNSLCLGRIVTISP